MATGYETKSLLIILGASTQVGSRAESLGCGIVHVQKPGSPVSTLVQGGARLYSIDYTSGLFGHFTDAILDRLKPKAVVSLAKDGLMPAAVANVQLGATGTRPNVVARLTDNLELRKFLAESGAGDLSPRFAYPGTVAYAAGLIAGWGDDAGVILRARTSSTAGGVRFIKSASDLASYSDLSAYIIEEYVKGPEYGVVTFSVEGHHHFLIITQKAVQSSTSSQLGYVTPPSSLSERQIEDVQSEIKFFLDTCGLRDGPAHTTFKLQGGRVKILKSRNCVPCDDITALAQWVTGIDLLRWGIGWPIGLGRPSAMPCGRMSPTAVAFATAPSGVVTRISLPNDQPREAEVLEVTSLVRLGDSVQRLGSSRCRVGRVVVTARSPAHALETASRLAEKVSVVTQEVNS